MSLHDLRNDTTNFDLTVTYDDFLHQLLSGHQPSGTWPDIPAADGLNADHFNDQSAFLSSKLRQQQITTAAGDRFASFALKSLQLPRGLASAGESAFFQNGNIDDASFKSPIGELDNTSFQNLFHGFSGSQTFNQTQQFQNLSTQKNVVSGNATAGLSGGGGAPSQPRQRVRARRGQATDPHSIAERIRRERIADRMKALQEIVPKANKSDKATMLDDIIDYVKFLQLQVKVLSMSRIGGAAGATIAVKGGDDFEQRCGGVGQSINESSPFLNNHTTTEMEKQVVKMMEDDMGSAMQYLQDKGLCLMPISLATTISATKFHPSGSRIRLGGYGGGEGGGPSSPNMSVLTVQSRNGVALNDSP